MVNERPPAVTENNETVQQLEADGGHDEQVDRGNTVGMIAQKRPPTLGRWSPAPDHVLGNSGLGDLDAELEQLPVDTRRTPEPVLVTHLADKVANLSIDLRAAATNA